MQSVSGLGISRGAGSEVEWTRVEYFVPQEVIGSSMEAVGAALCGHRNRGTWAAAELSGVGGGCDLKFLD